MTLRILILTNGPLCRNPRVVKEAETLGRAGFHVEVVGVANHPRSAEIDLLLCRGAPFRVAPIVLLPGSGPASFGRRLEVRFWRELATRFGFRTIHSLGPARSLWAEARRRTADLIIVHNEIGHWTGLRLAARGRLVAADIEDWHSEDLRPEDRRSRPLSLLREIERRLLTECCYTSTTSHSLADRLHEHYGGKRPAVLTNSFPLQPTPRTPRNPSAAVPVRFFWFSQTIGPGRGLEQFFTAWDRMPPPSQLTLLGEDRGQFAATLMGGLSPARRDTVQTMEPLPPDELPGEIARHDVGLALEDASVASRDLTITNKILQYLNAGLAVVATSTAGQREVLAHAPDAGVFIDPANPSNTVRVLNDLLAARASLASRQRTARRLAEDVYSWELEAPKLLRLVELALR